MGESDIRYLQRRADEEQQRADESTDRVAAAIHRRMATLYPVTDCIAASNRWRSDTPAARGKAGT